ncbi:MAG TPA: response regulator transcription factor [Terriglobia bacterium]|nr:response regulator transcription factor [Terriglobia bacterium]
MSPIQVLIVDDHAIFRQGLRKLFDEYSEFAVAGEAASGAEAINRVKELSPDIMLLDLQLGDMTGLDVLRRLGPGIRTRTILLGADIQRADELTAILLGASGVVGKYSASETLFRSIRVVMDGEIWVRREVIAELIGMLRTRETATDALGHFGLTAREMEIVKAVVQGMGNREISESLGISQFTVKHYMTRIFDKLLVANRVELALFATRQGLAQNRPR